MENNQQTGSESLSKLDGTWELTSIYNLNVAFEKVYPDKKPVITLNSVTRQVTGNSSCNSFHGSCVIEGQNLHFPESFVMTRMFCEGAGEHIFMDNLKKVTSYVITDSDTLTFMMGNIGLMKFSRK